MRSVGWSLFRSLGVVLALFGLSLTAAAQVRPTLGFHGTPSILEMPTADMTPDADLSFTLSSFGDINRGIAHFQFTPRLAGSFRYSALQGFATQHPDTLYFDRSFDISYQIMTEGERRPALTLGLRDFGGTGIYAGEYLVATKGFFDNRLRGTIGLGWGRLGSAGSFRNPLSYLSDEFRTRPDNVTGASQGNVGDVDFGQWFKGDAALFGGVQYQATDRLLLSAEISSDAYEPEANSPIAFHRDSPVNIGATYRFDNGLDLTGAYLYGNTLGLALSYRINPKAPPGPPSGREGAGPAVVPRDAAVLDSWDLDDSQQGRDETARVRATLAAQGLTLLAYDRQGARVRVQLRNETYLTETQAVGRAARALTGVLPPQVEILTLTPVTDTGLAPTSVTLRRSDLEELDHDLQGAWKSYARAEITQDRSLPLDPGAGRPLQYSLSYYTGTRHSRPDHPLAETGLRFDASYLTSLGARSSLLLSGQLRQPLTVVERDGIPLPEDPGPWARADAGLYDRDTGMEIRELMAEYFYQPGEDLYGRLSMGYLEQMYGGVSGELLWSPLDSPLALGAELNMVRKRETDGLFGFRDYETTTGFLSAYYDFGDGYLAQIDAGRYLAQDWGATLTLTREFDSGFRLGVFATQTTMSAEEFGEGSFDKGIIFSIPGSWLFGQPSERTADFTYRPLRAEGGARLELSNRLYDPVRRAQQTDDPQDWGAFWR